MSINLVHKGFFIVPNSIKNIVFFAITIYELLLISPAHSENCRGFDQLNLWKCVIDPFSNTYAKSYIN